MDFAKLAQMIANMLLRRGMRFAMKKGMDHMSKSRPAGPGPQTDSKDLARRARQAAKAARRLGR